MDDLDAAEAAIMQLIPYLVAIIDARRSTPGDDLLSGLLAVEDEGDTLSPAELIAFVVLLYVAGHETTVNLIGNGTLALLRNPDELMRWRDDPALDGAAIDELLRFDGPVQHTVRVPMEPVTFTGAHGETIVAEPGDTVLTVLGAANHDPPIFDEPHALRLDRPNAQSPPRVLDRHPLLPRRVAGEARGDDCDRPADPPLRRRSSSPASRTGATG